MNMPLLKVEPRERTKKGALKKVRREGFIPGIVYGHNKGSKNVRLNKRELEKLLNKYGVGSSVGLQIGDGVKHAIIKEVQRDIIKHHVLHVDFQELAAGEKVRVKIPLHLINKSAVESSTAVVQQQMVELEIQTYPQYLLQSVDVDVSCMQFGVPLKVKDLPIYQDQHIEVMNDPDEIIALLTTASKITTAEEEETSQEDQLRKLY